MYSQNSGSIHQDLPDDQAGINIRNYIIMLNIKDALAAHAECDRFKFCVNSKN